MCGRYYIDTNWLDEIGNVVYSFDIDWKICTEQFQGDILPTNTAPIIADKVLKLWISNLLIVNDYRYS